MKKKVLVLLFITGCIFSGKAQQIGSGYAPALGENAFDNVLTSGVYTSGETQSGTGFPHEYSNYLWKYLFIMKQNNSTWNQQFQLSTNFWGDDRVFFRKMDGPIGSPANSPWYELATRGSNVFSGEIKISGSGIEGIPLIIENKNKIQPGQGNQWKIFNMTGSYGNSLQFWAYDTIGCDINGLCANRLTIMDNGNVGIGIFNPTKKLDVDGAIRAKEVIVENTNWPDHVFSSDYRLPSLETVSNHIKTNKHLPGVPSAEEVSEQGVNLSEMQAKLLQKIEELTLYSIQQEKMINELKNEIQLLKKIVHEN